MPLTFQMDSADNDLVARLRRGERAAFETVVDSHYRAIYRQHLCLCGDSDRAQDLTQETFIEVWKALPRFEGRSSLRTWLYTIAVRVWRRRGRTDDDRAESLGIPMAEMADDLPDTAPDFTLLLEDRERRDAVRRAIERLPALYREAVVLFYIQGLSQPEVAQALEIPPGTVKSRLHEAVCRLKRMLAPIVEEAGIR